MTVRQQGFTLVEAIVALVILSMSMLATYSWINISTSALLRSDKIRSQELLVAEFVEHLRVTNLNEVKAGELHFQNLSLQWDAVAKETRPGLTPVGAAGLYEHTLYQVNVEIRDGSELIARYETRNVTTKQVRQPSFEL